MYGVGRWLTALLVAASGALLGVDQDGAHTSASPGAGADLIGTPAPDWDGAAWVDREPLRLRDLRGRVVLVRWWTETCPYCAASAPALVEFDARYRERGLVVIGMYHPKPVLREVTRDEVRAAAREHGFGFPIAIDRDWSVLGRWWLAGGRRSATSVSFLIDRNGVIRFVHPGPAYHRDVRDGDRRPLEDFLALERAIVTLLAEQGEGEGD